MAFTWSTTITPGVKATASDINELKDNIDTLRGKIANPLPGYSWTNYPTNIGEEIKPIDLQEMRDAIDEAEDNATCFTDWSPHYIGFDSNFNSTHCPTHYSNDDLSFWSADQTANYESHLYGHVELVYGPNQQVCSHQSCTSDHQDHFVVV